ncbi:XrtA/PEP-CTERM system exopolysaccharide export protein [Aquabacterium sp.]|uniref:XrtA/PEP-CTERM system exopolysaccharide export protein n=1 Tax=Aquabacterium sp. TaxID=1872578 RepID=UPI002E30B48E|nr:XrtA/PEP-CTERM system exopolysaccharide export protein [Aquabacterium sp.]HEX5311196.1 XrtA/PEP-CTERM system exopolysaccharide export protein [Aquabacterium sp.]
MSLRFMPSYIRPSAIALSLALAGAVSLTACGSLSRYPEAPAKVQNAEQLYKIGAMDVLNIVVWRNPELSANITVRPDGRISLPLVEDLQAAGRNPADLSRDIEKALSKFIREPVVTVVVNNFQGVSTEQIRIVGEAGKPQSVPFRKGQTILDVMLQAGGLTDFADGNGAVLVRGAEGGKQYSVRLKDLLKRGDISANVEMMPGDIVIIPQSWF